MGIEGRGRGEGEEAIASICILSRTVGNYGNPVSAGPLILWTINFVDPVIPRSRALVLVSVSFLTHLLPHSLTSRRPFLPGGGTRTLSTREIAVETVEKENDI